MVRACDADFWLVYFNLVSATWPTNSSHVGDQHNLRGQVAGTKFWFWFWTHLGATLKDPKKIIIRGTLNKAFGILNDTMGAIFFLAGNGIVTPPNSNTFSDWRRTFHVSLVKTSWRSRENKTSLLPCEPTTWTFDSHVIRSCTFETAANLFASRVKQIIFTQSWQLNGFKQELKKKLSSFNTINAPNLLTRWPTMPWERWENSAKSKIWTKAPKNLHLCIVLFWVRRYNQTLNDWPLGKQWVLFPLDPHVLWGEAEGYIEGL